LSHATKPGTFRSIGVDSSFWSRTLRVRSIILRAENSPQFCLSHSADVYQFMVAALTYAIAVNFVPEYRNIADQVGDSNIGLKSRTTDEEKVDPVLDEKRDQENAVEVVRVS
jgi:hypothetical protein